MDAEGLVNACRTVKGRVPFTRSEVAGKLVSKRRRKKATGRVRGTTEGWNRADTVKVGGDLATDGLGV